MASERQGHETKYSFNVLSNKRFSFLHDRHTSELFMKWSMLGRITAQAFNFDQYFHPYKKHDFALDFFKDPCVKSNLKVLDASGLWKALDSEITKVNVEAVPCTRTSMDLFDALYSCGILRPSGHIVKCFHDFYADFDELRNMLLIEDSDNYEIICREDREEFLFRLFKHFCLGGELCQYEDVVDPYIETTKSVYKDLISVQKDPEMKEILVTSTVLKVSAYDDSGLCYPSCKDEEQTFAYFIVDPFKRHVYVLYHCFGVGLFSVPEKEAK
ncbi:cilia- and flagella-associated protein 300 [Lepisosteus oculatus]|uniref:cilia- and flagella-associated protein 300 n=1 Tax=Lepisosteus oculatus TaxID=7918 RepID=UPI0037174B2A